MDCPVEKINLALRKCPVNVCLYNKEGDCNHANMQSSAGDEESILKSFPGLTAEKLATQVSRIKIILYVDAFAQFTKDSTLLLLNKGQIESLKEKEDSYNRWPKRNPEINFNRFCSHINTCVRILFPATKT